MSCGRSGRSMNNPVTEESYIRAAKEMIYLAACALKREIPDKNIVKQMNFDALYTVAERHQLTAITAMALESVGIKLEKFTQAKGKAIRKNAALDLDRAALSERLEAEHIWYMPLKGAVIAAYYPEFGMRQMSDNDILIDADRAREVKQIMCSLGFTVKLFGRGRDDEYAKEPVSFFEIHRSLFSMENVELYEYYRDIASRLMYKEGRCERYFSNEDFYLYLTAHEYMHFSRSGTGIRSLLDIYVFWQNFGEQLDMKYLNDELKKMGIADFEKRNRSLALRLFAGEALTEQEEELLHYFIFSGVYGTIQNLIKKQGRWNFFFSYVFKPYRVMATKYPILQKKPFLLPVCWFLWLVKKLVSNPGLIIRKLSSLLRYKN